MVGEIAQELTDRGVAERKRTLCRCGTALRLYFGKGPSAGRGLRPWSGSICLAGNQTSKPCIFLYSGWS